MASGEPKDFNIAVEPKLNTDEMRELQLKKLRPTLDFFYDHVPFERRRMDAAGIKPADIRDFDDYAKAMPIAGQADYRKVFDEVGNDMRRAYDILFGRKRMQSMHLLTTT